MCSKLSMLGFVIGLLAFFRYTINILGRTSHTGGKISAWVYKAFKKD